MAVPAVITPAACEAPLDSAPKRQRGYSACKLRSSGAETPSRTASVVARQSDRPRQNLGLAGLGAARLVARLIGAHEHIDEGLPNTSCVLAASQRRVRRCEARLARDHVRISLICRPMAGLEGGYRLGWSQRSR